MLNAIYKGFAMTGNKVNKNEVAGAALEKIKEIAEETGLIERTETCSDIFSDEQGPDLAVEISGKIGRRILLIEAAASGEPRIARQAVYRLLALARDLPDTYPVFAAPYISEQAAEICRINNTGCLDLAGNCRIAIDGLFLHTRGNPNPYKNKRRLKSPAKPRSARIIRVLLNHPHRKWKTRELAAEAGVSLGLVANVKQILKDRELIDGKKEGILLSRPQELLGQWIAEPAPDENIYFFHTDADFMQAENAISQMCAEKGAECAFTGISAALHLASGIDYYRRIQVRVHGEIDPESAKKGFTECSPGSANLEIIHTHDPGVFYGMRRVSPASRLQYCRPREKTVTEIEREVKTPINIVSPVQAYFDLLKTGSQGKKEAEKVLRQVIEPSW